MDVTVTGTDRAEAANASSVGITRSVSAGAFIVMIVQTDQNRTVTFATDKSDTVVQPTSLLETSRLHFAYIQSAVGGSTVFTGTPSTSDWMGFTLFELGNVVSSSPVDGTNSDNGPGLTSLSTGSITPASAGIRIAALARTAGGTIDAPGGSWISVVDDETYDSVSGAVAYQIAAAGAISLTWGFASSDAWAGIVAFAEGAGGGGSAAAYIFHRRSRR
jgi:hypothetical protein